MKRIAVALLALAGCTDNGEWARQSNAASAAPTPAPCIEQGCAERCEGAANRCLLNLGGLGYYERDQWVICYEDRVAYDLGTDAQPSEGWQLLMQYAHIGAERCKPLTDKEDS